MKDKPTSPERPFLLSGKDRQVFYNRDADLRLQQQSGSTEEEHQTMQAEQPPKPQMG